MLSRPALLRPAAAKRRGFTLLELIVVLLILGILAAIAIPTFNRIQANSVKSSVTTDAEAIARNANGIAASQNGGLVNDDIMNLAAAEAYGFDAATVTSPWTGSGKSVALSTAGGGLTINYTSGSTTCVVEVVLGTGDEANKAVVNFPATGATGSNNCPDQAS